MRVLLVSPGEQSAKLTQASWLLHNHELLRRKAFTAPLHIATIAALTPEGVEVDLWDELVQGLIDDTTEFDREYDLVGVTGYGVHFHRVRALAQHFRRRGIPVAAGGAGVTSIPELYREYFDILFVGEAEETWPRFMADFQRGEHQSEYRSTALPDLARSPAPRWDSIAGQLSSGYLTGSVQVTRGCPFTCEFCDVWQVFGRAVRTKPVERVLGEIRALQRLDVDTILLCSDNYVGNRQYAKELTRALVSLNASFEEPVQFRTELTITVARDEELLAWLADANFTGFLVGLESPNADSLKETRKLHNLRFGELAANCLKVMSYGIPLEGSMIVGFDSDTPDIFDQQYAFLHEACIPFPRLHLLKAIRGTDLWQRLKAQNRVVEIDERYGNTNEINAQHATNIMPLQMSRAELLLGYMHLMDRILDWDSFEARVKGFVANVAREPRVRMRVQRLPALVKASLPALPDRAQEAIGSVLAYTEQQAPFMMVSVSILALRHLQEVVRWPHVRAGLTVQVEAERVIEAGQRG